MSLSAPAPFVVNTSGRDGHMIWWWVAFSSFVGTRPPVCGQLKHIANNELSGYITLSLWVGAQLRGFGHITKDWTMCWEMVRIEHSESTSLFCWESATVHVVKPHLALMHHDSRLSK